MTLVLPFAGAVEAFMTILQSLPFAIKAFINFSLFIPLIPGLVRLILGGK